MYGIFPNYKILGFLGSIFAVQRVLTLSNAISLSAHAGPISEVSGIQIAAVGDVLGLSPLRQLNQDGGWIKGRLYRTPAI